MSREIDKKIAELKGMNIEKHPQLKIDLVHDSGIAWLSIPQWSTQIDFAWELWEELPTPKTYEEVADKHRVYVADMYDKKGHTNIFYAETFPLAVCKAWIDWKETP